MSLIKKKDMKEYGVFPLEIKKAALGPDAVYDRDTRGKSWFILDLILAGPLKFIPAKSTGLATADGERFVSQARKVI